MQCRNTACQNKCQVNTEGSENTPIMFCSQSCLNQFVEITARQEINPDKITELVQSVVMETKKIQGELDYHKKVRNTYFHLFKDGELPQEKYVRKWSFEENQEQEGSET